MFCRIHILIIALIVSVTALSQQPADSLSNLRMKMVPAALDSVLLDTFMVVPNSVHISGVERSAYRMDYNTGFLFLNPLLQDSVLVTYRVFPFRKKMKSERFNYDSIRYNFTLENPYTAKGMGERDRLVDFGDMNYYGSFGRGISFGNNQDAVVSSSLNLQINGFIGDSLEFTAAISDNNIPIQPDGNTHNIQDFERIFMQVKKHGWQLNFGDIDIRQSDNRYFRFFKRLQGASFLTENELKNGNKNSFIASGALSKGKFARNVIEPKEGNQGPYKLYGSNNELFFAVLAGTEKVYIDGALVERGEDRDYVIDYNMAEIIFTARRLITRDSRIQVEFEYGDRNFLNSMLYAKNDFSVKDKWKFSLGAYSNSDAKNSPINQTLSDEQKHFLSTIGNDFENAFYPYAAQDTFSTGRILYKKQDTTVNGITDTIYIFSVDRNDTLYNLSFTNVGFGNGNYIPSEGNANGRVFEWVAPVDDKPQGEYEPVQFLVTPKKHQVFSGEAGYALNENTNLKLTGALSNYDPNTFSSVGNNQNNGMAVRFDFDNRKPFSKNGSVKTELNTHLDYEYVDRRFKSIETLRNVEFYRDWGMGILVTSADESLVNFQVGYKNMKSDFVKYSFSNYRRDRDMNGFMNSVESIYETKGFRFDNKFYLTNVNSGFASGNFFRPSVSISKTFKDLSNYRIGASYSSENNQQLIKAYDTLSPESFAFNIWKFDLNSNESKPAKWGISYFSRDNLRPDGRNLTQVDRSDNFSASAELAGNQNRQLRMNATYRKLHVNSDFDKNQSDDESLLGRADYSFNEFKGFLNGSIFYELGAGQEQKRQYTYVEVPAGQGLYMWIDYNEDGVPQLDEFEIAVFEDQKRWVRILTPTDEYLKANYVQFNYNLSINPQKLGASDEASSLKFLKRFNTVSALQINKKEISQGTFIFNPFAKPFSDESLISLYSFLSNTIYFNRANPVWGMDLTHRVNSNKAVLSYGFESNRLRDLGWRFRLNFTKMINTNIKTNFRRRMLSVPAFDERNYDVGEFELEPSLSYTYKTDFRASLFYGYRKKKNGLKGVETSVSNSLTADVRYNAFSSTVLSGKLQFNNISFDGSANTPVGYLMLDGLLPGKNLLWNFEVTKRLAGNIEMNLQYEGRKPAETRIIHTGRASLRAIF